MKLTEIRETDAKQLLHLKNLLIKAVKELEFKLGDAKVANQAIEWFDAFLVAANNTYKLEKERERTPKEQEDTGLSSLKIKEFSPGLPPKPVKATQKRGKK